MEHGTEWVPMDSEPPGLKGPDTATLLRHACVGGWTQGPRAEHEEDLGR